MDIKYLYVLIAVAFIVSPVKAVEGGRDHTGQKKLEILQKAHHHNTIFDDYSLGGSPYEPYKRK